VLLLPLLLPELLEPEELPDSGGPAAEWGPANEVPVHGMAGVGKSPQ
jgi:hypothetical protein